MVSLGWVAAGAGVVVVIFYLGYRINQKKATARLALRLAEVYRADGDFETARTLYQVPAQLDQNLPQAREGSYLADEGVTEPVIEPALMHRARRRLVQDPEGLAATLAKHGVEVRLPEIEAQD